MNFLQYSFIFCSYFRHNAQRKHFRNYYENVFFVQNYKYLFTLFSIYSVSIYSVSIYSLFNLLSFQSIFFSIYFLFDLCCFNLFYFNLLSFQSFLFSLTVRNNKILTTSNTGKMTPAKIPIFRFSDAISETNPTKVGPPEHPASPASASIANNAVPPFLREADALLNVPGHMIPTDNPQIEQPINAINGDADSDIVR